MDLSQKIAVVTGGTKGIGRSIVVSLLKRGYFVFTNYAKDLVAAQEAKQEFSAISSAFRIIQADQSNTKTSFPCFVNHIKQHADKINCIVCNAGATVRKPTMELTDDEWERIMQISVNSHFYLVRELYRMVAPNSRIIFIGSAMGVYPHSVSLPYGVSKAAIHAMAKNLVKEFDHSGTTVNAIAPGFVETEWQKNKPQQIRDNICKKTAAGRFAKPEEIASAVLFCIDNDYINGSIIKIDGGYCYL